MWSSRSPRSLVAPLWLASESSCSLREGRAQADPGDSVLTARCREPPDRSREAPFISFAPARKCERAGLFFEGDSRFLYVSVLQLMSPSACG